jgi:hypothetical protein
LYKARILRVINGAVENKKIKFVVGLHAPFSKKKFKDWLVVLEKMEDKNELTDMGAEYYLKDMSFPARMYCLGSPIDGVKASIIDKDEYCYDIEDM